MNKLIAFLIFCSIWFCSPVDKTTQSNEYSLNKNLPKIVLTKNKAYKLPNKYFAHSVGGEKTKERTIVQLNYDDNYLEIKFECLDNPWVDKNSFTEDNTAMHSQEVFELYISNGSKSKEDYLEIQLNPNNALFLGKVNYKYKSDKSYKIDMIDTKTSGVIHSVKKDIKNKKWSGKLKLPLSLLHHPEKVSENIFRLNMYRITLQKKPKNSEWKCNSENSSFGCWNSTMSEKPQFHSPESFGYLILK